MEAGPTCLNQHADAGWNVVDFAQMAALPASIVTFTTASYTAAMILVWCRAEL